jgi:hypothetical protein
MAMELRRTISNAANFTKNIRNWLDTSLPPPPPFAAFTARIGATDSCITLLGNETLCVAWLLIVSGEEEDSSSFPFCDLIFTRFTSGLIIFQVLEFSQSFNPLSLKILLCCKNFPAISQKILLSESQSSSHIADFLSSYCQFFPLTIFQHLGFVSSANERRTESQQISKLKLGSKNSLSLKFKSQRQKQQQQQQRDNKNSRKKEICSVLLVRNRTKPVTCESAKHLAYSPPPNEHKGRRSGGAAVAKTIKTNVLQSADSFFYESNSPSPTLV